MAFGLRELTRFLGMPVHLYLFAGGGSKDGFTNAGKPITRDGVTYQPWTIKHGNITVDGTLDRSALDVTMASGSVLDERYIGYPPDYVTNLSIFQGHADDEPTKENFPLLWGGRVLGGDFPDNSVKFSCEPISTTLRRPGLRLHYQLGCPHVLYGPQCRASKASGSYSRTVSDISGQRIYFSSAFGGGSRPARAFAGGLLEWTKGARTYARTIISASSDRESVLIRGPSLTLADGDTAKVIVGCNRTMGDCTDIHGNVQNFGGCPFIPLENPLSTNNQFF